MKPWKTCNQGQAYSALHLATAHDARAKQAQQRDHRCASQIRETRAHHMVHRTTDLVLAQTSTMQLTGIAVALLGGI